MGLIENYSNNEIVKRKAAAYDAAALQDIQNRSYRKGLADKAVEIAKLDELAQIESLINANNEMADMANIIRRPLTAEESLVNPNIQYAKDQLNAAKQKGQYWRADGGTNPSNVSPEELAQYAAIEKLIKE